MEKLSPVIAGLLYGCMFCYMKPYKTMTTVTQWHSMILKVLCGKCPCTSKRRIRRAHRVAGEPGALWKLKAICLPWLGMVGIPLIEMVTLGMVYGIGFATLYNLNRAVTTAIVDGFNMFQASYTERLVLLPLDAGASSKKGASCHGGPNKSTQQKVRAVRDSSTLMQIHFPIISFFLLDPNDPLRMNSPTMGSQWLSLSPEN